VVREILVVCRDAKGLKGLSLRDFDQSFSEDVALDFRLFFKLYFFL